MGEHQVCLNSGRSGTLEAAEPDRLATHQVVTAQQRVWDKMGMGDCGNALASTWHWMGKSDGSGPCTGPGLRPRPRALPLWQRRERLLPGPQS